MTGFVGFGDGNYEGMLPNGWDGGSIEGEVEELGKVPSEAPRGPDV